MIGVKQSVLTTRSGLSSKEHDLGVDLLPLLRSHVLDAQVTL